MPALFRVFLACPDRARISPLRTPAGGFRSVCTALATLATLAGTAAGAGAAPASGPAAAPTIDFVTTSARALGPLAGRTSAPDSGPVPGCPAATVTVGSARDLTAALAAVRPGAVIVLLPGVYFGKFVVRTTGTAAAPITLCGPSSAVLDGGNPKKGTVLALDGASHWRLSGFTIRNGQKGVIADRVTGTQIESLTVERIGDEAIHLRRNSTDNRVVGNRISGTGLRTKKFGEGIYVGSAQSNWSSVTGGAPDRSDRNEIVGNTISGTTAEAIDVKEGTTGGRLAGNVLDGSAISAADSAVDVKGNEWLVSGNRVVGTPWDGFQTHRILTGWGDRNVFVGNTVSSARKAGGAVVATTPALANIVRCDNSGPTGMKVAVASCR